jgi:GNAT superfamily N-acetyltransferase
MELSRIRLAPAVTETKITDVGTKALREFAELPGLSLTWEEGGKIFRHLNDRLCVFAGPTFAVVTAMNVDEGQVSSLLDEVRNLVPADVHTDWYIGPSARPTGIVDELKALGIREPSDGSGTLHALLLDREPTDLASEVETHEVSSISDHAGAAEVQWEAFERPLEEREHERGFLVTYYEEYMRRKDRSTISFVATVDGRIAGTANALLSDRGLFLIGGSTAPWARGRGVYRALVAARWRYAVDRGTPALTVHAIHNTSSPILRRAGFTHVCTMRHLEGL